METIDSLKIALRRLPPFLAFHRLHQRRQYRRWLNAGQPVPPPHMTKQLAIKAAARRYGLRSFVETGTYMGDMVYALLDIFDELYSIEVSDELFQRAARRFALQPKVHLVHGDSASALVDVLHQLKGPAAFWLDGHYSGGSTGRAGPSAPILKELELIAGSRFARQHYILIDDARAFVGNDEYPDLTTLRRAAATAGFDGFAVESDVIHLRGAGEKARNDA